jgi:fatty acid desaturase
MTKPFQPAPELYQIQPSRSLGVLVADWCLIGISFAGGIAYPVWFTYLVTGILIARTQLALAVMMHESAHGVLLPNQRWNDAIGQLFAAAPLFLSMATYRAGHIKHHQNPMMADDPVSVIFQINDYPLKRHILVFRLLTDLSGVGVCLNIWHTLKGTYRAILPPVLKSTSQKIGEIASIVLIQGGMLALLTHWGHAELYLYLWIMPALTLLPFMGRMRAIMEHAGMPPLENQALNARTISNPSWQTFLFGPHAIHYHIEHHLYVRVPFYHLGTVHRQMLAQDLVPLQNVYQNYAAILIDVSYPSRNKS